jgi:hypothetical protein
LTILTIEQAVEMRRREFIALVVSASAWPLTARTQQATVPIIGVLVSAPAASWIQSLLPVFRQGLKEAGYAEGHVAMSFGGLKGITIGYPRWPPNS